MLGFVKKVVFVGLTIIWVENCVMFENCDVIVIFQISGQFGAVQRPDSGHRVCNSYVFSNSNLFSSRN